MTSLENLKYHLAKNVADWEDQHLGASKIGSSNCEVVGYTNTPRNLG
jgi:hypothetical protein